MNRCYMCIDLKSFYASVECVERKLDPLTTNLVVADYSRTEKTICLAVTPSLKQYGLSGRSRLYEVVEKVKELNKERKTKINKEFIGKSSNDIELKNNDLLELDFIIAPPRMKYYVDYSTKIYSIYLKYISSEDIFVYSIDEVFCDVTNYLNMYKMSAKELATKIISDVYESTGITATAGIGTNLYLAKVAMDIEAKHSEPNSFGVRIAEFDEIEYRNKLWNHEPLTDFWRIGRGISKKLIENGMKTMGDIARCSIDNENLLFRLFGVNAELLIDHAWGWEPCTIDDIKKYKPKSNSLSSGQVLYEPYDYKKARLIVSEMVELLTLSMVEKHYVTNQLFLTVGYDISNLTNKRIASTYNGEICSDYYGRKVPKPAHGSVKLDHYNSSTKVISKEFLKLFDKIINPFLLVRRINIAVCNLLNEDCVSKKKEIYQFNLFSDMEEDNENKKRELLDEKIENKIQRAVIGIKRKYGKNAILKGMNLEEGGTTIARNNQIGGHKC